MPETETTTPDLPEIKTCDEYFQRYQVDAILWRADRLLNGIDNPIQRNECFEKLAHTIAKVQQPVAREDYAVKIGKQYNLQPAVFRKMIADAIEVKKKQEEIKRTVRKNKVLKLEGNAKTYPFFNEILKSDGSLDKIIVNKVRYIQLMQSFGFARYEVGENDKYTFVKIRDNVIQQVNLDEIIDELENFVNKEYDFSNADLYHVDAEKLLNKLYDGMNTFFSKKLFGRLKSDGPILINKDKSTITYLYFKNGFVEVTDKGYELKPYDEMEGSVWDHQVMPRDFKKLDEAARIISEDNDKDQRNFDGDFADFVWKISGRDGQRFKTLCCIIGYLVHDFYKYTLKMIYFTDSTVSDNAQGRTGKTLLMRLIGSVRSFVEIPGKNFNVYDEKRYQMVKLGTQLVHINDVDNKGRNRFELEPMFNDITDGLQVRALYLPPFVQYSKMAVSGNGSLFVQGDSAMDRVLEFEVSSFFSRKRRPVEYYGRRLADDWDAEEWNRFDNFICWCSSLFHQFGLLNPPTINLEERKLRDFTGVEFIEFMQDRIQAKLQSIPPEAPEFDRAEPIPPEAPEFDRAELYTDFKKENHDFNNPKFTQRRFNRWLEMYGQYRYKDWSAATHIRKSNGKNLIRYE